MSRLALFIALLLAPSVAGAQGMSPSSIPISVSGCPLTGCTFTGLVTLSTGGLQISTTGNLSLLSNVVSPIVSPETQNSPSGDSLYISAPLSLGYAETAGSATYSQMQTVNLTVTGTVSAHWGRQESSLNILGTGTMAAELNDYKSYVVVPSGATVSGGGENFEAVIDNSGALTSWKGFLSVPTNESGGTVSGRIYGYEAFYKNAAASFGAIWSGYHCTTHTGGGGNASNGSSFCVMNEDNLSDIMNSGHYTARTGAGAPTLSCGTSPTLSTGASDVTGTITIGTGSPATCTLTFNRAYSTNAPIVQITPVAGAAFALNSTSTTTFVLSGVTSGAQYEYTTMGTH